LARNDGVDGVKQLAAANVENVVEAELVEEEVLVSR
jgi:hypothetical protein